MINFLTTKSKSKQYKNLGFLLLLFMFCFNSNAQTTVTGTVSDSNGPIPGANVTLKNSTIGATTNLDGVYTITNVPANGILVFSYIGLTTKEIAVKGQKKINVTLAEGSNSLKEVVVIGYGTSNRANVTGAIASISATDLDRIPVSNAAEALRGQLAGVQVTRGSGQPGAGVSIKIRGTKSLGGTSSVDAANQAIIVVDGTPILGGNLNEINPDDIETMTVLKDAASAAIYGASSSNGVILITTKKGKAGKATISVSANLGIAEVAHKINFANGTQYVKYLQDATVGGQIANGLPTAIPSVNSLISGNELTNFITGKSVSWQDLLLRQSLTKNASISASGGTENFHYYMNGDAFLEDGIITASDYNRYSYRLNTDYSPSERVKIGANVQLSKSFANETANAITEFNGNGGFAPFIPISNNTPLGTVYNEDGTLTKIIRPDQFQINPLWRYKESQIDRNVTRTIINPYIEIKLWKGFSYKLNASIENRDEFYGKYLSSYYSDGNPNEGTISKSSNLSYLVDNIMSYKKEFGKHNLTGTFVYGFQQFEYEQLSGYSKRLPTDLLGYNALGSALTLDDDVNWFTDESGKAYLVGRLGYSFDNRYVASFSVRRDGSSKFGPSTKYGIFPSASVAWNITNEKFLSDNKIINDLKFRASIGVTGNDNFPTYGFRTGTNNIQFSTGPLTTDVFNGYAAATTAGNPNLKWEESRQFNIGLDYALLNNRISGTIDYYQTNNIDLLLYETINPVANGGATRYASNVGETRTRGLELSLKANVIKTPDFSWTVSANWAMDRNELVRLTNKDVDAEGNPINNAANGWFIGQDFREIFDWKYIGVWQKDEVEALNTSGTNYYNAKPGDPKIADLNDDKVINDKDRTFLGNPTPKWYGGLTNTVSYKGLELSVLVEAVQGVTKINSYYGTYNAAGLSNVINIDYWTPDNPTNAFPRVGANGGMSGQFANAIKVQDASFVSLRNVALGYKVPKKILEKTFIKDLSFSVIGNNLMYFTDYKDAFSPESGIGSYPITKTWTFGTKITF